MVGNAHPTDPAASTVHGARIVINLPNHAASDNLPQRPTRGDKYAMPLFEYRCMKCNHDFEELVAATGRTKVVCPNCGATSVEKLHSVFAARADASPIPVPAGGGCGRCGDPAGPCGM